MKLHKLHLSVLLGLALILTQVLSATNTLELIGGQTNANDTAVITVNMVNDSAIVAFQFDISLPSQLTYIDSSAFLSSSRLVDHILEAKILPGDTLRIFGYSLNNTPFLGDSGTVVTFKLYTGTVPGNYPLDMYDPLLGDTSSTNVLTSSTNGTETILGPNISLTVNALDFGNVPLLDSADRALTINNVGNQDLNVQNITFDTSFFKVVGNSTFTVPAGQSHNITVRFNSVVKGNYANIMTLLSNDFDEPFVNVDLSVVAFAVNELHTGNMSVNSGDYATLDFSMNNMEPVVGFQFDVNLADPLTFIPDSVFLSDRKANHSVSANMINSNTLRVVAYSENSQHFSGNDGLILRLGFHVEGVGGYYGINISNVVIGDTLGLNAASNYFGGSLQIAAADITGPTTVDFGDVSILESSTKSVVISNYGNDTLEIGSVQFSGSSFSTTQTFPLIILAGNHSSINISFSNGNEGSVLGNMKIFSNDPDENPFIINLTGNAYVPNYITVKDSTYIYGDTMFVDIEVDNLESFTGFQFDLNHTDSLTCLTDLIQLGQRVNSHETKVTKIDSTTVRLIVYSLSETDISGSSGVIASIPFIGDSAIYGAIPMSLDSAILGNSQSQNILWGMNNNSIVIAKPQEIELQAGWNIFSLNVEPEYMNMDSILASQMKDSTLIKVVDEEGNFMQNIPGIGWFNTIGNLKITDGYYAKVSETDTLTCDGSPVVTPFTIPLQNGWNIMGYPLVDEQDALVAMQPLIDNGSLYKMIDEQGGFIQYITGLGWLNTIGNLAAGEGYYIKVDSNVSITLSEPVNKSPRKNIRYKPPKYFNPIQGDIVYNPMNFVLKFEYERGDIITPGDEIAVFDGEFCVGAAVIPEYNQDFISIVASMNDEDLEVINGYIVSNGFSFKFWDIETNELYGSVSPQQLNETSFFQPLETYIGSLSTNALGIKESDNNTKNRLNIVVAPNPVLNKLTIYFLIPGTGQTEVEIFSSSGIKLISTKYNSQRGGWNSRLIPVSVLRTGFYTGKIVFTNGNDQIIGQFKFVKL